MRDNDGRKLDHNTLEAIRICVVRQVEAGARPDDIAASLGLSRSAAFSWVAAYRDGGLEALRAKPVPGRPSKLSDAQIAKLYAVLMKSNPAQQQLNCSLWTRTLVRELIHRQFDVTLSEASVGRWLRRIGLSPRQAPHRAGRDEPEQVRRWRTEIYPQIRAAATRVGAALYFIDEATLDADDHADTATMISAVTPRGLLRFAVFPGTPNPHSFIALCKRLLSDENQRIFLIAEDDPVHHCRAVADFITTTDGWLRLFFLPPRHRSSTPTKSTGTASIRAARSRSSSATSPYPSPHTYDLLSNDK